jgi:surface protein
MRNKISTYITALLLMLGTTARAETLKGTLLVGKQYVPAEFQLLGSNTVAVGNGRNACISQLKSSGMLTIPSQVTIDGTTYNVTEINRFAFRLCDQLTGVNIQENVTKIDEFAFVGCSRIKDITLPASLQTIGAGAFISCYDNLESVTCLGDEPARWEALDVFRPIVPGEILYNDAKRLYVANSDNYAKAEGWQLFQNVKFGQATYYVYNAFDLTLLRERAKEGSSMRSISKVVLANDIDMTGVTWDSGIGLSEEEPFLGNFDGQGHTITGLTITGADNPAFFSHYGGRTLEDVTFKNCHITNTASDNSYAAVVVGECASVLMYKVWVEGCTVAGPSHVGGIIGHALSSVTELHDCVVKDITLNFLGLSGHGGGLIAFASGGSAERCAIIGDYFCNQDIPQQYNPTALPFVGHCAENDEFYVHDSYASHERFGGSIINYEPIIYDTNVVLYGQTVNIIDTDGNPAELKLNEAAIKSPLMAGLLGRLWTFAEGRYPLPNVYADRFPVEINKASYCLNATSVEDIPTNRLFSSTAQPEDFLNLSPNGYTSKAFITSRVWIDDNFTAVPGALPIGTATIDCNKGVIYNRVLKAEVSTPVTEKAPLVDVDKDGEVALSAQGEFISLGGEVVIEEDTTLLAKGFSVCLPYDLTLNGSSRVFQPTGFGTNGRLLTIATTEAHRVEAWKPCIVTVQNDSVPLSTTASVVLRPKSADHDFAPADSRYAMVGTAERTADDSRRYFGLQDNELWEYIQAVEVMPFRAYITASEANGFETFSTGMGYRAELRSDTLTFCWGLPVTEGDMQWWRIDYAYLTNDPDDYFDKLAWRSIAEDVNHVEFDQSFSTARPQSMEGWFYDFRNVESIGGLEYLNTSEVESMLRLFGKCNALKELDLRHFDTRKVEYVKGMFEDCSHLEKIIIGKDWTIDSYYTPIDMFNGCVSVVGQYGKTYDATQTTSQYANGGQDGYLWRAFPYYVAVNAGDGILAFRGSDTAPDGISSFDAIDSGSGEPAWHRSYDFSKAVIEPSFILARPTSCSYWFAHGMQTIEGMENLNTSHVTSMKGMFAGCQQTTLDLSHLETYRVEDMSEMFKDCGGLTSLDVTNFNTACVTTMDDMFSGCQKLASLDVTGFKTFNVKTMKGMFLKCDALQEIDLNNFNISKLTNTNTMFARCIGLRTIWCDNSWAEISEGTNMFALCYKLEGAATYMSSQINGDMANPETGYFTASPAVTLHDDADNSEVLAKYEGRKVNICYDRVLRATQNSDGSWSSKAYSICLPYDLNIVKNWIQGKASVYMLYAINGNKEFLFSNNISGGVLKAGHAYLVVVEEGEVSLDVDRVVLTAQPSEGDVVVNWDTTQAEENVLGRWCGTFHDIESADAAAMQAYGMWFWKGDPYFVRVRYDTPNAWLKQFRAFFVPDSPTGSDDYTLCFKQWVAGDEEYDPIVEFPADEYDAEEFPVGTGIDSPFIHTIDTDGIHRYFDLQGRQIPAPASKGIYIDNGKKVINK